MHARRPGARRSSAVGDGCDVAHHIHPFSHAHLLWPEAVEEQVHVDQSTGSRSIFGPWMKQLKSGRIRAVRSNTVLRISIQDGDEASNDGPCDGVRVNDRSKLAGELDVVQV